MYRQRLLNLSRQSNFPISAYGGDHFVLSAAMIGELRELSYFDRWRLALERGWFHLKMQDHSLFLFQEGEAASYSYLQCPLDVVTLPEFLRQQGMSDTPANRRASEDDYQSVLDTAAARAHVTPIRFDYNTASYRSGIHPAAHLHIGLDNSVRIAVNRMNAVTFVLFVMRQMYPAAWACLLGRACRESYAAKIRATETKVPGTYWQALDKLELSLQ